MGKFVLFFFLLRMSFGIIPIKIGGKIPQSLKRAGNLVDRIYWRQSCGPYMRERENIENDLRKVFILNYGPFNRFERNSPIIEGVKILPGVGNYPEGIREKDIEEFLEAHPEMKDNIESPYAVIVRDDDALKPVPYHLEFQDVLEKISTALKSPSSGSISLDAFLKKRGEELLEDKFEEGDSLWLKIDKGISSYIGPSEIEDPILGVKMAYGEVIFNIDDMWTKWGKELSLLLPEIQKSLPLKELKGKEALGYPGLLVSDLIYTSGIFNAPPAVSFAVLPPSVSLKSRKVFFKNSIEKKFSLGISKVGSKMIYGWDGRADLLLSFLILHDISHCIGTGLTSEGKLVWEALGKDFKTVDEIKADAAAAYFAPFLSNHSFIKRGDIPSYWRTYLAYLLYYSSKRKSVPKAEINFLLLEGGIRMREDGKIEILKNFRISLREMLNNALKAEYMGKIGKFLKLKSLPISLKSSLEEFSAFDFYFEVDVK